MSETARIVWVVEVTMVFNPAIGPTRLFPPAVAASRKVAARRTEGVVLKFERKHEVMTNRAGRPVMTEATSPVIFKFSPVICVAIDETVDMVEAPEPSLFAFVSVKRLILDPGYCARCSTIAEFKICAIIPEISIGRGSWSGPRGYILAGTRGTTR